MRINIINEKLSNFNQSFKVKSMNYDMVLVKYNDEAEIFNIDDVELIAESSYDEMILEYKDILKIRLDKGISPALYEAIINFIENKIDGKMESLEVLKDEFKAIRKNMWEKQLVVVVNNSMPFQIIIVAAKYAKEFSITFKDITLQNFIEGCSENMECLKKEIEEREKNIERYRHMLKEVMKNSVSSDSNKAKKLAAGC